MDVASSPTGWSTERRRYSDTHERNFRKLHSQYTHGCQYGETTLNVQVSKPIIPPSKDQRIEAGQGTDSL